MFARWIQSKSSKTYWALTLEIALKNRNTLTEKKNAIFINKKWGYVNKQFYQSGIQEKIILVNSSSEFSSRNPRHVFQ